MASGVAAVVEQIMRRKILGRKLLIEKILYRGFSRENPKLGKSSKEDTLEAQFFSEKIRNSENLGKKSLKKF